MNSKICQMVKEKKDSFIKVLIFLHLDSLFYRLIFKNKIEQEKVFLREIKAVECLSDKEQATIRQDKLLEIFEIAFNNTTYYHNAFTKEALDPKKITSLKGLPILTKDIIIEHYADLINSKIPIKSLSVRHTGGTIGTPMKFLADRSAEVMDNAHHWFLYEKMGYQKNDLIINSLGIEISEKDRKKNIFWKHTYKENVWGEYIFSTLYLNEKTVKYYVAKILEIKPKILRGIPSFYNVICHYILENALTIDFKPLGINLTSEVCSDEVQEMLEKVFLTKVYFEYGHREISLYCYSNGNSNTYKSSALYGYIEVLEEDGSDTPVGGVGRIVTTGLINKGMPFIRYDTGDYGCVLKCESGVVYFSQLNGRSQDYILDKDKNKFYLTSILPQIVYNKNYFKNVKEWQIEQEKVGEINLYLVRNKFFIEDNAVNIKKIFFNIFNIDVKILYMLSLNMEKSGKRLLIIQKVKGI